MTDFVERLSMLLGHRRRTPWGERLGSNKGTIYRMFHGEIPRWETLCAIQHMENVSISWLLTGAGPPYLVVPRSSDADCAAWLDARLAESADWSVHVPAVPGSPPRCAVLTCPAVFQMKSKPVAYTRVEVAEGAVGPQALARVEAARERFSVRVIPLPRREAQRLARGEVGTRELVGDGTTPGLLSAGHAAAPGEVTGLLGAGDRPSTDRALRVAESPASYGDPVWHNVSRLSETNQQVVRATVEALLRSEGTRWEEPN